VKIWRRVAAGLVLIALASLYGAAGFGCGSSTPCDDALTKVQNCGVPAVNSSPDGCASEVDVCNADCILKADCAEIRQAAATVTGPVVACSDACR
jgi:hypothetical protein